MKQKDWLLTPKPRKPTRAEKELQVFYRRTVRARNKARELFPLAEKER